MFEDRMTAILLILIVAFSIGLVIMVKKLDRRK